MSAAVSLPESPKVLVVDDAPANLIALGAVLKPLGLHVVEARSGKQALDLMTDGSFAVALLDVQMPEMDGFELAKRIRQLASGAELPIIFLTAIHADECFVKRGYQSGAADYITKPFDADVLRARVKAFADLFHKRERIRVEQLTRLLESERAARREAEIANGAKDEFLATVSHELRTPLNAILGWSIIARDMTREPPVQRALDTIERNARAQMRIIEDVLDIGHIMSGKLRLEPREVDVVEPLRGAIDAVKPAAEAKEVALEIDLAPDLGKIWADQERVQQIVWNLLSNAIKFTPKGGHVTLCARCDEHNVILTVADDGQGIEPEFLPHVFEPFRQADGSTTRRHGGLGLGLAIVKQLVQAHGGNVAAESLGAGRGSTFTVQLPVRSAPKVDPTQLDLLASND
jgi:signal transduction histidine kinase